MIIRELTSADHQKYEGLAAVYGSVFDSLQWTKQFGGVTHYGIYDAGDELIGGFFSYTGKKYGVSIFRNPPLTPTIGPFFKISSTNPVSIMEKYKQMITLMAEFIDKKNYPIISFSLNKNIVDMQPFIWREFKVVPEYTYILDLALSVDDIWKRMSNERRKNITRGTKDGLIIERTNDYTTIKALVLKTYSRQNKEIDDSYMDKVLFEFADDNNSFAFIALNEGKPIACTFCVRDNNTAYYLLGGYASESKHHGAGAMCMWEAIKHSKQSGLSYFDFEGSMVPAIERYFRGFGGELTPYYRINKAKLPLEIALKFFKRELF